MTRLRSADDFAAIRARKEELQRERAEAACKDNEDQHRPNGSSYGQRTSRTSGPVERLGAGPFPWATAALIYVTLVQVFLGPGYRAMLATFRSS